MTCANVPYVRNTIMDFKAVEMRAGLRHNTTSNELSNWKLQQLQNLLLGYWVEFVCHILLINHKLTLIGLKNETEGCILQPLAINCC